MLKCCSDMLGTSKSAPSLLCDLVNLSRSSAADAAGRTSCRITCKLCSLISAVGALDWPGNITATLYEASVPGPWGSAVI